MSFSLLSSLVDVSLFGNQLTPISDPSVYGPTAAVLETAFIDELEGDEDSWVDEDDDNGEDEEEEKEAGVEEDGDGEVTGGDAGDSATTEFHGNSNGIAGKGNTGVATLLSKLKKKLDKISSAMASASIGADVEPVGPAGNLAATSRRKRARVPVVNAERKFRAFLQSPIPSAQDLGMGSAIKVAWPTHEGKLGGGDVGGRGQHDKEENIDELMPSPPRGLLRMLSEGRAEEVESFAGYKDAMDGKLSVWSVINT